MPFFVLDSQFVLVEINKSLLVSLIHKSRRTIEQYLPKTFHRERYRSIAKEIITQDATVTKRYKR
jgi:nitrogenase subunit NifH